MTHTREPANPADPKFADADFADVGFTDAHLAGADLAEADFTVADFAGADLAEADFTAADFARADLAEADFTDADFARADLAEADFTDAGLARGDLAGADLPDSVTRVAQGNHRAASRHGRIRSTTILGLVQGGRAALGGDGQVTFGSTILKTTAHKTRLLAGGTVLAGFAGSAADGLQLFEKFELRLESLHGNLRRAAVDLAREWRTDRVLRRLDAQIAAVNSELALIISGNGDVVEPDDGIVAIGSGGPYALAACRALTRQADRSGLPFDVREVVEEALRIAAEICIYTGSVIEVRTLEASTGRVTGPASTGRTAERS